MPSKQHRFLLLALITSSIFASGALLAATSNTSQLSFDNWVERVKKQAQSQGISSNTLENAFSNVQQVQQDQTNQNDHQSISSDQLLRYSLTNNRVTLNKQLVNHYSDVLFEIKHLFDVNPEVIIALWGIDNIKDKEATPLSAIDVLTSLSYTQPTNKKLKKELFQALKIIDEGKASQHQLKSDANGRLGATPFKPTTFRDYAIDYDGDGKIDIWQNHADIFASTANYLNNIGWKNGEPWGIEVKLPMDFNPSLAGLNQQRDISHWQTLGIRMPDGSDLPENKNESAQTMGSIISTNINSNKTYLVFDNYFALLRWKRSQQFAFAVGMMVDKIKQPNDAAPLMPFADVSN